jgi:hypothetical protein
MAAFWSFFWRAWYRAIRVVEPGLRWWLGRARLGDTVEVVIPGRRTGLPRSILLGLLAVGERRYIGHPAGAAAWTRNLDASGRASVVLPDGSVVEVAPILLDAGPERDAVIRATFRQHPFPGNVLYWMSRGNLRRVGRFYRLEPVETSGAARWPEARAGR